MAVRSKPRLAKGGNCFKRCSTRCAADRQIITLIHLEERSLDEAASLTGTNKLLLKVRAYRARARMKAALDKLEPDRP